MYFETYLHGFQYFTLDGSTFKTVRAIFFAVCVVIASCMLFYQTFLNVTAYLKFDVMTAASFEHYAYGSKATALDFPAITICPNNMFLADQVGFVQPMIMTRSSPTPVPSVITTFVTVYLTAPGNPQAAINQCKSSLPAMRPDMVAMGGFAPWTNEVNAGYWSKEITHNSVNSVVQCKWQGRLINCADLFINRLTDQGACFTFYPTAENVASYALLNETIVEMYESPAMQSLVAACFNQTDNLAGNITDNCVEYVRVASALKKAQAFGTTPEQILRYNLTTSAAGPRSGLELFLNVLPKQYCADSSQLTYGFAAVPHARDVAPILEFSPLIEIPAGFIANIAISVTQITRKTESIGKCTTNKDSLVWWPSIHSYSYDACVVQCFAEVFDRTCDCVPFFAPPFMFTSGHAVAYKDGQGISRFCTPTIECYTDLLLSRNYTAYGIPASYNDDVFEFLQLCDCPPQCSETQYRTEVSFAPLASTATYKSILANQNITIPPNVTEFRKSFAIANFYYKSLDLMHVVETQAIQIGDVINGVGGSFGLCLGGSFITIVEIAQYFVRLFEHWRKRRQKTASATISPEGPESVPLE